MRAAIAYPPVFRGGKRPLLGQNRQFKYTHSKEIKIFPLVPAHAATSLRAAGHEVLWLDGINNENLNYEAEIAKPAPEIILLETKAPVLKKHWEYIGSAKLKMPKCKFVLAGDHASFFPGESMKNSSVDYVITGGDYDAAFTALCGHLEGRGEMPPGVWYRENGEIKNSGRPVMVENLDELPFIDRELTRWKDYGEAYLYRPCAYILTGRGCGREGKETGGVCTFCVWQHAFWEKKARLRSPANVAEEIEMLVKKYGVYEVFDDNESGAVWSTAWLERFVVEVEKRGLKGGFVISSNARAENLTEEKCRLMKRAGYRLLKVGLESASNATLKRIGKLESIGEIKENIKRAKDYGFRVLLTMMVGYPWETEADVKGTYEAAKELMLYKIRFGDSLQASIVTPYPGTPLYRDAQKNGWLTEAAADYENFDMEHDILKSNYNNEYWCRKMWNIHKHPLFLLRSLISVRGPRDIALALRGVKSLLGHTKDY